MNANKTASIVIVVLVIIFAFTSLFTVREGQQAILLRLGKIERDNQGQAEVYGPGLHFKIPFLQQVAYFDTRLQTLEIEPSRVVTVNQKEVIVDYYVKWRIVDPVFYYTRTSGNARNASILLTQQLNDKLRAEFGKRSINDVISDARLQIMKALEKQANIGAKQLGLQVVDVRIKRIDLPEGVTNTVYNRMRARRKLAATEHRSLGKAIAEKIRAQADATATITIAKAQEEAARIRAQGNAVAAKIYAHSYKQNPEFYAFYRSLAAYKDIFNHQQNVLVLKPDSQFFKYFNSAQGHSRNKK